jgi:hypothetical protein
MSSLCHAKVVFHIPKYRYAVFTPEIVSAAMHAGLKAFRGLFLLDNIPT